MQNGSTLENRGSMNNKITKEFKMRLFLYYALFFVLFVQPITAQSTDREKLLISHLQNSILLGEAENSKLIPGVLNIVGMSSPKVRHFLNNLCSLPGTNYLEIGIWRGSTHISALFGNEDYISHSVGFDNWSEFGGPYNEFLLNLTTFLPNFNGKFYSVDCFSINKETVFSSPVNIYFYDGQHTIESQKKAFTFFNDIFDNVFIAVVDDWNFPEARLGTRKAFEELKYVILFESILPARYNSDLAQWWNGLYVAVIRKPSN